MRICVMPNSPSGDEPTEKDQIEEKEEKKIHRNLKTLD